jgi:lipopolysaccharide transport system ATP-binding protein
MAIIEVKHLTKEYQLGKVMSIRDTARNSLNRILGRPIYERERFKALDDVDFQVEEGDVVGIIGTNGAGKSTLLKHLAHITTPTKGEVIVRGSVAPLIEVGAGLNRELTGRENIFLNAAILGIPRKTIRAKLDEIIEFSELQQFIDTPIKRYSSGMSVRLGFSIATSLDGDILIVDEVLAVGDLAFQRKCFDKMEYMIKRQGKTVLLVSHNIRQIERMCSRTMLLDNGRVIADGSSREVCNRYYEYSNKRIYATLLEQRKEVQVQSSGEVAVPSIDILNSEGSKISSISTGDPLRVRIQFKVSQLLKRPEFVVGTHTTDFFYLSAASTATLYEQANLEEGFHDVQYIVRSFPVTPGTYSIRVAIFDQFRRPVFMGENLCLFRVTGRDEQSLNPPLRSLDLPTEWYINGKHYDVDGKIQTN